MANYQFTITDHSVPGGADAWLVEESKEDISISTPIVFTTCRVQYLTKLLSPPQYVLICVFYYIRFDDHIISCYFVNLKFGYTMIYSLGKKYLTTTFKRQTQFGSFLKYYMTKHIIWIFFFDKIYYDVSRFINHPTLKFSSNYHLCRFKSFFFTRIDN